MSARASARRAAREAEREAITSDLLVANEIASASKAFAQAIGEVQDTLAYLERRGVPSIYRSVFETRRDKAVRPMSAPLTGVDAQGRALMAKAVGGVVVHCYMRRTRRLALLTKQERQRFVRAVKTHPRAAAQSFPARKARASFRTALKIARAQDRVAEAAAGFGHA